MVMMVASQNALFTVLLFYKQNKTRIKPGLFKCNINGALDAYILEYIQSYMMFVILIKRFDRTFYLHNRILITIMTVNLFC